MDRFDSDPVTAAEVHFPFTSVKPANFLLLARTITPTVKETVTPGHKKRYTEFL